MVEARTRALASAPHAAYDLLASSSEVARNSVVAFARVLHPVLIVGGATNLALLFAGQEHAEVLQAAVICFRDNMPQVAALFANDPQLVEWLAWVGSEGPRFRDMSRRCSGRASRVVVIIGGPKKPRVRAPLPHFRPPYAPASIVARLGSE
jgi:hypothetical protein